jgi:hypothetical protein
VVVDYLDVGWPFARPAEANAELLVDSDAVLTLTVSLEGFKVIGWWSLQIVQNVRDCELI